jgi:predicted phosphatase
VRRVLKVFVFESHFSYHLIIPNQRKNHKIDEILTRFKMDKMITLVGNNVEYDELLFLHQSKLKNFDKFTFKVYKLDKQKYNTLLVYIDELHNNA